MKPLPAILLCLLVLAVAAGAIWLLNAFKSEPVHNEPPVTPRLVSSMVVERADRRIDVAAQGTVTPRTEIDLVAEVAGKVKWISNSLANGGFFAANEVLVQIDDRDYALEVTRAKALVAQAELRVEVESAEAEIARREWESVGKGGTAASLTLREPQVKEAKAGLASAKAALGMAELALERTRIHAPFAGRVRAKTVDAGQFVAVGAALARVYAIDFAEVRLPLRDSDLKYLDVPLSFHTTGTKSGGPTVTLRADFAQQEHTWVGTIVRTEGEVDPKSRMVHAIARVADPYGRADDRHGAPLSVGMFVTATIRGRTFASVMEIPRSAVRDDGSVLVIDADSRLRRRPVAILHRSDRFAIVEKGLAEGERICLSPISVFVEGMPVESEPSASKPSASKPAANGTPEPGK